MISTNQVKLCVWPNDSLDHYILRLLSWHSQYHFVANNTT